MKTLISFSVLVALLSTPVAMAGPAPGMPGPGARVTELARSRAEDRSTEGYALTGRTSRERSIDCRDPSSLSLTDRRSCNPATSVSHRRFPGGPL